MGLRNQKSSTLLQQQQHCGHLEPFHRAETVIDRGDGGIGDQLAGDREFVIGQALDQFLSHRIASGPQNSNTILWRVPKKVIEAQAVSSWPRTVPSPPVSPVSAARTRSAVVRRGRKAAASDLTSISFKSAKAWAKEVAQALSQHHAIFFSCALARSV